MDTAELLDQCETRDEFARTF